MSGKDHNLKAAIRAYAVEELGFDVCGFSSPWLEEERAQHMRDWLSRGLHGEMAYLEQHLPFKEKPEELLEGVRCAIVLAVNYKSTTQRELQGETKIARYAVGRDYHLVIKERLSQLEDYLSASHPGARSYSGVDSRPIDERGLAIGGGVGFQGRNTMLIRPGLGSYFFLAVVYTTLELGADGPITTNCGTCRACLDACPTDALLEDGSMDATRCISYLTIEQKEPVGEGQLSDLNGWIFGCDICQEICPFNKDAIPMTAWGEFMPGAGVGFGFFENASTDIDERCIPKETPLHRSRKRIIPNFVAMRGAQR
ncbi:MAG: tRNA epoxyqueuosine(34) reductase QueG [Verrucomicrobia bacterium]|nr:tRNA epoxyqueuosine(34) reductase QueG [Verrucomicrobiota bacterium]MDA1087279.1 tRNA epoxyqueuosine(34) reductase QueG [Verrucomicrobiota bacterium]